MIPRRRTSVAALALAAGLVACSAPTAVEEDDVAVTLRDATVEIQNDRSGPIFVRLVGREAAERLNQPPCPLMGCPVVPPGGTHAADRADITGLEPESEEAILHWWRVVSDGKGGFEATDVHAITFPLR